MSPNYMHVRSGSWDDASRDIGVPNRCRFDPTSRCPHVGFRCVRAPTRVIKLRGGCWLYGPRDARVSYRYNFAPAYRNDRVGFRCVRGRVVDA